MMISESVTFLNSLGYWPIRNAQYFDWGLVFDVDIWIKNTSCFSFLVRLLLLMDKLIMFDLLIYWLLSLMTLNVCTLVWKPLWAQANTRDLFVCMLVETPFWQESWNIFLKQSSNASLVWLIITPNSLVGFHIFCYQCSTLRIGNY